MKIQKLWLPLFVFIVFFLSAPVAQLVPSLQLGLKLMPGDIGDARLNNYFLENIYQFFIGGSDSLWHLGFFWPFPYVLGFSDNLFGSSPVYIIGRILTGQPDTAFQIWFLFAYVVNYWAAYYTLTKLGIGQLPACVGAVIFAFAIPVTAHAGHAQLHYRFGVPLSLLFLVQFLEKRHLPLLTLSGTWLVWQFYSGIYIGFFTALLLLAVVVAFLFQWRGAIRIRAREFAAQLEQDWVKRPMRAKAFLILAWAILFGLLALLFYPYLQVKSLYGIDRSWNEIQSMLPRVQSYFLADSSWFWSMPNAQFFGSIPMRHEHQMFTGVISMALLLIAVVYGVRTTDLPGRVFTLMVASLGLLVLITLNIGGLSLWFFFHWLPLASAIRAMTRIDLVMLLPLAFAAAYFLDQIRAKFSWGSRLIVFAILPALLIELSATSMPTSLKADWRLRLEEKIKLVPKDTPKDAIIFFSTSDKYGRSYVPELDAMWASITLGKKTMNGYSGAHPQDGDYGSLHEVDCSVLPQRIMAYAEFSKRLPDVNPVYQDLIAKVIPIGFEDCPPSWWTTLSPISTSPRIYSKEEFSKLALVNAKITESNGIKILYFDVVNNNDISISAKSGVGRPIRVSWRYFDESCKPRSEWDTRKDIAVDIPAKGLLPIKISLDKSSLNNSCGIEVSIVQELVFWGHDIGVTPLRVNF